ncbi:replication associated protein [Sigmofec virus UA08Rod_17037]|uniref:Replication-associated protein n=1 Tax=Sigmofec virus UA08Rod_17037 TaxID=2929262 RepID=A0A976R549_9VIRU|nr:replication associated protein [Sigmofec virus UA08Rod_17037]
MSAFNGKNWAFTAFCEEPDAERFLKKLWDSGVCQYLVGQLERAPTTGGTHVQGFVSFTQKRRLTWIKSNVDPEAHFEPAKGTAQQNKAYCTKEDSRLAGPWEFGDLVTQGKTKGLDQAIELIKARATDSQVAESLPAVYVRHYRGLQELRRALKITAEQRTWLPELWVLIGPSGSGKSRWARETFPDAFWKSSGTAWWDGYWGQETVVLDDFSGRFMPLTDLQHLLDGNPMQVEIKGGSVPMLAKRIVITSNWRPDEWYSDRVDPARSILRRVHDFAAVHGRYVELLEPGHAVHAETGAEIIWPPVFQCSEVSGNTRAETSEPRE